MRYVGESRACPATLINFPAQKFNCVDDITEYHTSILVNAVNFTLPVGNERIHLERYYIELILVRKGFLRLFDLAGIKIRIE